MLGVLVPAGLLLGLTLPVVVLFYLLRVRRTDQAVSSLFLWQAMPRDTAAQEPLQRLRLSALLFLQLALLALLTFALARPAVVLTGRPPVHLIVLLDASASMQAVDPGQATSRFERARAAAEATIRDAPEQSLFSVIEARAHPQLLLSRETDAFRGLQAVQSARVSGAPADMAAALLLARSLVGTSSDRRVAVYTDQAFSLAPPDLDQLGPNVEVVSVSGPAANTAVTAVGSRQSPGAPDAQDLFVRLQTFAADTQEAEVELRVAGVVLEQQTVQLGRDATAELVFQGVPTEAGAAAIAIQGVQDALPMDDVGYLALQARRPSQVLLVSNGDQRLERALALVRGAEVFMVAPRRYLATDVDHFDVVVFDRDVPPILPRGNVLILGPSGTAPFLPPGPAQSLRQPQALTWEQDDPLLVYVDLRGLSVRRARILDPPPWARTLVKGDDAPLMFAGLDTGGRKVVALGFAPSETNLAQLPAFPILINNLLAWLAPPALVSNHQLPTGGATDLIPLPRARDLLVTAPRGGSDPSQSGERDGVGLSRMVVAVPKGGAAISFGATDQPGVYTVEQRAQDGSMLAEATEQFAVNLASPAESDLRPRPDSAASTDSELPTEMPLSREWWSWVLGLAVPLLALEGWWFHRGGRGHGAGSQTDAESRRSAWLGRGARRT